MIAAVETALEPPAPVEPLDEAQDDDRQVDVTLWLTEADGTRRMAAIAQHEPDVDELAEMLIGCLYGVARLWGPALVEAVTARIGCGR